MELIYCKQFKIHLMKFKHAPIDF